MRYLLFLIVFLLSIASVFAQKPSLRVFTEGISVQVDWIENVSDRSQADVLLYQICTGDSCQVFLENSRTKSRKTMVMDAQSDISKQILSYLSKAFSEKIKSEGYQYRVNKRWNEDREANGKKLWSFGLLANYQVEFTAVRDTAELNPAIPNESEDNGLFAVDIARTGEKNRFFTRLKWEKRTSGFLLTPGEFFFTFDNQLALYINPHLSYGYAFHYFDFGPRENLSIVGAFEYNFFPYRDFFKNRLPVTFLFGSSANEIGVVGGWPQDLFFQLGAGYGHFEPTYYINAQIDVRHSLQKSDYTHGFTFSPGASLDLGLNLGKQFWLSTTINGSLFRNQTVFDYVTFPTSTNSVRKGSGHSFSLDFGLQYYFGKGRNVINPRIFRL